MAGLAQLLLNYYDQEGRKLPWRGERDLYRLWISEIMLQQTGVTTVLSYYPRFLKRFPTIQSLALATDQEVLSQWQGLGYYRRAHHLHRAAQQVVTHMNGQLPEQLDILLTLPGIGPSTGAAILAIGRDQPHAILDGNVKRVLSRLMALNEPLSRTSAQRSLWSLARELTPDHRPGDYAQAIMDLGATLCSRTQPACQHCPWLNHCQAYAQGKSAAYPLPATRPVKPYRAEWSFLMMDEQNRLLLCQRPAHGLLAGLWEPPSLAVAEESLPMANHGIEAILWHHYGVKTTPFKAMPPIKHSFTHFHLTVYPFHGRWVAGEFKSESYQQWRWVTVYPALKLPLATLHRKVLATLSDKE